MEHGDPNDGSPMSSGISEIQGHGDGVQDPLTNLAFWSVFQQILLQNNIFCPKMIRQIVFNANFKFSYSRSTTSRAALIPPEPIKHKLDPDKLKDHELKVEKKVKTNNII